jgi:Domain of unknown function (DUF1998)
VQRGLDPNLAFPGLRYVLLHSLAHALIRQFSVECGYAAASLKERISSSAPGDEEVMAGMLIYTAAPDSEGTLGGGLVSLGDAANLEQHLNQALEALEICSSDPLCAETQPEQAFLSSASMIFASRSVAHGQNPFLRVRSEASSSYRGRSTTRVTRPRA